MRGVVCYHVKCMWNENEIKDEKNAKFINYFGKIYLL